MFLKRLELYGFKSFAERLDICFSAGMTAIVGPNGSGKSNVSDAVRWVLGEQSAKQLRGGAMADVIFKGTESRKPLSYCEVSLVFDNTDKGLNLDYTEVVITRRLYRSGESEYYINRTACRLKDIIELFQDTGIGKEGYSIVGQGKIENILSGKQEDRRAVFEEAAGIVKYRSRKNEAERKLERTADNLTRINDILDTLSERVEPLAAQADTAREYLALREDLRRLEVNFFLLQSSVAQQKRDAFNQQLAAFDEEKEEKTALVDTLTREAETLAAKAEETERLLAGTRQQVLTYTQQKEQLIGQTRVLEERVRHIAEQKERNAHETQSNEERRRSLEQALHGDAGAEEERAAAITALQRQIENMEESLANFDAVLIKESESLEKEKAALIDNMNRLSDVKSNQSRLETMLASIDQRRERIALAREQILATRVSLDDALEEQKKNTAVFTSQRESVQKEKDASKLAWQKAFVRKAETTEKLENTLRERQAAQSRLKVLEDLKRDFEGFQYSVKRLLTRAGEDREIASHICGVLAQLISVPEQYEIAVEAALGSAMQNIVTPTEEDAKALIDFLRSHDAGRATFLPVSAIKGRTLTDAEARAARMKGCFGAASDLITYDARYAEIVKNLLGRTVITEDLDVGIALARKTAHAIRIVTLQGDVINAGGSMSGGSMRQKTNSLLGREREIDKLKKQLSSLDASAAELKKQAAEETQKCGDLEAQINSFDERLHELDVRSARDFEKLHALENDMAQSKSSEDALVLEEEQLADTRREIEHDLEEIGQMHGRTEIEGSMKQDEINARSAEHNQKLLEREKLAQKLTDARVECAGMEKELDAMRHNAERMKDLIVSLDAAKEKLALEIEELAAQEESVRAEIAQKQADEAQNDVTLEATRQTQASQEQAHDSLGDAIREREQKRRRFEQEIFETGEKRDKIELQLAKLENDLSYLETRIWEEYELTLATAEEYRDLSFKQTGAQTEINRLRKAIAALGNVNVNAIEEYVETKERLDSLSSQRDDLVKAKADLEEIIAELTKKMDKQFREQFALINQNFNKVFRELFGGGRAELKLGDGDNSLEADIEIVAQPPGKSLQLLSLLSGGERALTAIAILFAMMKLKPTPFCILDEIEAALDEANVGTVAAYLRRLSQETQFIVITHRKPTMEEADSLYGVAMEEKGVSKIVSVRLTDAS